MDRNFGFFAAHRTQGVSLIPLSVVRSRAGARLQIEFGASCNLTRDQYAYIHIDQELSHQFSSRKMNTTSWVFFHSDGKGWDGKEGGF
jgi:hypothetical protein